ncbi:telomere repeats-binding bouquet formation protein 1-like [Sceloporus undulatus]|uniref:telomere repeats-binding bouquet formation protein 1-like n=1 Tax=Sceloporus undulatus TaxID=8520 RepID=UPI001C4D0CA2|nr:telomere repeats-binding bouquet formation protein 1-like [Sceloporus undulatus]
MENETQQKIDCEMKTDLNLLLECLKYQMDHPVSQKEALVTIYSACQHNSNATDYFQEIGGLLFVYNLAKSSKYSMVKEAALFTLGGLAESNGNTHVYSSHIFVIFLNHCVPLCPFLPNMWFCM